MTLSCLRMTTIAFLMSAIFSSTHPVLAQTESADIVAKAAMCSACHGAAGAPALPGAPVLWGQTEGYIYLQLKDLKSGARESPMMNGIAASMTREDMFALAKHFTNQPWPNLQQPAASVEVAKAAQITNSSIGCTGCHLANYQGNSAIPRLAGQKEDYLLTTMLAFRSGERANNPGMSSLMNAASPEDLKAMAAYLAGL